MFYSREKEIKTIREWMSKQDSALLLYGKLRAGKTSLIKEVGFISASGYDESVKKEGIVLLTGEDLYSF